MKTVARTDYISYFEVALKKDQHRLVSPTPSPINTTIVLLSSHSSLILGECYSWRVLSRPSLLERALVLFKN